MDGLFDLLDGKGTIECKNYTLPVGAGIFGNSLERAIVLHDTKVHLFFANQFTRLESDSEFMKSCTKTKTSILTFDRRGDSFGLDYIKSIDDSERLLILIPLAILK